MNLENLTKAIKNGEEINTSTHAVGGGEWSIEVHGSQSGFLGEYVGSNGTREYPAEDLWSLYYSDLAEAEKLAGAETASPKEKGNGGRVQRRR